MLKGTTEMTRKIQAFARSKPQETAAAAYAEAEIEVTEMKKRTPVDITPDAPHPGNLRNSIHAEEPQINGNRITVIIATGAQAPYAIFVHEIEENFHPVGEWKFMESVLNESERYMAARIARRIKF